MRPQALTAAVLAGVTALALPHASKAAPLDPFTGTGPGSVSASPAGTGFALTFRAHVQRQRLAGVVRGELELLGHRHTVGTGDADL